MLTCMPVLNVNILSVEFILSNVRGDFFLWFCFAILFMVRVSFFVCLFGVIVFF